MLDIRGSHPKPDVAVRASVNSREENNGSTIDLKKLIVYIGIVYFAVMAIWVIPVACVTTVTLLMPLSLINRNYFIYLENKLCAMVNSHWTAMSVYVGTTVTVYGKDLRDVADKRCLCLANHLGLLDHFVLMQSLNNIGSIRAKWMWVIFNIWKYTPLGFMWMSHGNFFINGGVKKRESVLKSFREHLRKYFHKFSYKWVVMYPEGSRLFLVKDSGKVFAEKNGLEPLNHCVYPRTGAAHAVLDVLGPKQDNGTLARCGNGGPVEYVIDATIGYKKGIVPNISEAVTGDWQPTSSPNFSVHYDVIPVKAEWSDEEKLKEFLYERYQLKDKLLNEFYKTGRFPDSKCHGPVIPNQTEMVNSQVFWLAIYFAHYYFWMKPVFLYLLALVF